MTVRPGAEAFARDGDDVGVLLLHGFTGNPSSLRPWAEGLAAAGRTVRLPRLPGHGTSVRDMARTGWPDWLAEAETTFRDLRRRCRVVAVGGLSMGGALALALAQKYGPAHNPGPLPGVDGVILVNPAVRLTDPRLGALPVLRWVLPWLPPVGNDVKRPGVKEDAYDRIPSHALHSMLRGYRTVVADLPAVSQPLLVLRSTEDHVVPASSSALILDRVTSSRADEVILRDSYHVATIDNDAGEILRRSLSFLADLAGAPPAVGVAGRTR
ncbi:esterase [Kineosporia sp. NBRC 101677]|uniref:alpha/beta hydrolase n=1 Tax=Kineosporia sp. NBRC 101677 TaxID=3032197 RepID=UPI00249FC3E5|nr:alpha/beta fold hydrolase [Kineosporia sp. NBRC 101677]GLY18613.1 esterase [Kineosporia sp. NBRC 101677]